MDVSHHPFISSSMPSMVSSAHNDGPDPAEEQHLAYLQSQIVQPSPLQPPHHDHIHSSMPSTPQQRSVPSVASSVIQTASPSIPNSTTTATTNSSSNPLFSSPMFTGVGASGPMTPMTPMTPVTPVSTDPGIVPQLQNIVSTVNLGCRLDLKKIALHARNAEYNPKRFAAVIMRIREPRTTALIFSSGKMVCTGAKSEEQSRLAARKYARIVQKLGFDVNIILKYC